MAGSKRNWVLAGAVLAVPALAAAVERDGAPAIPVFIEADCGPALASAGARCGRVRVLENRAEPSGRTIDLNVVVLPATTGDPQPPLFALDGGPGLPATIGAGFYLTAGAAYRAGRDVVLVDQRGTGQSNGLHCPELAAPPSVHRPMLPRDGVRRCREELETRADLRQYGTTQAVADLDAVRAALGYGRIDLFGLSYGTTVALRYMATYPDRVRAAVLMGVGPPTAMPPRFHAPAAQRAMEILFEDCAADPDCSAAFPEPWQDLRTAVERLDEAEGLQPEVFLERLRSLMYSPTGARQIPWIVSHAAAGDLSPFYAATSRSEPSPIADGMFLSVTCSEAVAPMPFDDAVEAARSTVFGDYRLRRQRAACAEWPIAEVPPDFHSPVRSEAPVLMLSGRIDPVTPPQWAEDIRPGLPNSNHIELRYAGHLPDGLSDVDTCFDRIILRFLLTANPQELDASCTENMRPPSFRVR